MYKIALLDGRIVYDSSNPDLYPIAEPSLSLELNDAGSLEFTIFASHPLYSAMQKMRTFVTVTQDDEELFYGRVLKTETDLYGQLRVTCEGAITFFLDSEMAKSDLSTTSTSTSVSYDKVSSVPAGANPHSLNYYEKSGTDYVLSSDESVAAGKTYYTRSASSQTTTKEGSITETISEFVSRCIRIHNSQVEVEKQFTVGTVNVEKASTEVNFKIDNYTQTKSVLESLLTGKYGGYFRIRKNPNGPHYFDYIQSYDHACTQQIKIAENIVEKNDNVSGENIFTILRPLGKNDLNISSLSQSDITLQNVTKDGNKLRLTNMIAEYGQIIRTERFSDIDDAHKLLEAAEDFIKRRGTQLPATCDVTYVDFHLLNPSIEKVSLGDTFTNIDGFTGQTLTVASMEIDMADPANNTLTLKNDEEINANDPASSSSSLSASYASKCTHIDYIYKYIHESDKKIQIATDEIVITAANVLQLSGIIDYLTGNMIYVIAEESQGTPGKIELRVATTDGESTSIVATLNNVAITNGNLTVDGYIQATELRSEIANLGSIWCSEVSGNEGDFNTVDATEVNCGTLEVNGTPIGPGSISYVSSLNLTAHSVRDVNGNPITIYGITNGQSGVVTTQTRVALAGGA